MRFFTLVFLFCFPLFLFSQASLEISVVGGGGSSTCRDLFFNATPMYQVDIEKEGVMTYPRLLSCYNDWGNVQYTSGTYGCPQDVIDSVEICIKVFDNDAGLFDCNPIEDCAVEICEYIEIIPAEGYTQAHRISTPSGGSSEGYVDIEVNITGSFTQSPNDHICGAVDLGVLNFGNTAGEADLGGYENICAEEFGDPDPRDYGPGGWYLHRGVWFTFETGADPSGVILLNMVSDPLNLGNNVGLQGAIFTSSNDECDGDLTMEAVDWDFDSKDDTVRYYCPPPNTKFYVLVDGIWTAGGMTGHFGIEVLDPGAEETGDLICESVNLGAIPAGGSVQSNLMSNFCLTNNGDPNLTTIISDQSAWLSFIAPSTGHVLIEGFGDKELEPIDLEMAVFESDDNSCNGNLTERASASDPFKRDEVIELSCLTPGDTYFILVDGGSADISGLFEVKVTELFDDTPITNISPVVCHSGSYQVGLSNYASTGFYVDTILLGGGCDSVIYTDLTVLDPISVDIQQIIRATGLGSFSASAEVTATGGSEDFSYEWSDGQNSAIGTNLEGGETYCVTVTDNSVTIGTCEMVVCLYMEYITPIIPTFSHISPLCNGDTNGSIIFSVNNGEPPYSYQWSGNSFSGNGTINDDEQIQIDNLPSGDYEVSVTDIYIDTVFTVRVIEPTKVGISIDDLKDAACFGYCDGEITVSGTGGVGNYNYSWETGSKISKIENLCSGTYGVSVTDGNNCEFNIAIPINQPAEFIATGIEDSGVTCRGWTDGAGSISTNGSPISFAWQGGQSTASVSNLSAGEYFVTVTNSDGCFDTTSVVISEPEEPYLVNILVDKPIQCNGDKNGVLNALASGGNTIRYQWNNNVVTNINTDLGSGSYLVTVTNSTGCEAVDSVYFNEPEELSASPVGNQLTCLDPDDGGVVTVLQTEGGLGPYEYSVDGVNYFAVPNIGNLFPGDYDLIVKDELGCEREFPFSVIPPPDIDVDLPDMMEVDLGDEIVLDAITQNPRASFEWSNSTIPCSDPSCGSIEFQPLESETLRVTATDTTFYCTASAEIAINVLKKYKVFIPSAFSPNNDGINDKLTVFGGKDVARIRNFKVFDRYGSTMYSQKEFDPNNDMIGWDGSWKGRNLSTGVYVYYAEIEFINGEVEIFKGDITIAK